MRDFTRKISSNGVFIFPPWSRTYSRELQKSSYKHFEQRLWVWPYSSNLSASSRYYFPGRSWRTWTRALVRAEHVKPHCYGEDGLDWSLLQFDLPFDWSGKSRGIPLDRIVIGGFGMGGNLAMHVGFRYACKRVMIYRYNIRTQF